MNVLIVNSTFTGGGAEKIARQLYYGLSHNSDVNTFFIAGKLIKSNEEVVGIYDYCKIWIQFFNKAKNLLTSNARKKDRISRNFIISFIKSHDIDIVHFHNIHGNYIGMEDIGEIAKHCRVIWTLHDMWALTGHCAHPIECSGWLYNDCKKCHDLQLYPKMFFDKAYNAYKVKEEGFVGKDITFIVPSMWLMEQCKKSFLSKEKIFLIYNGVNTSVFYPLSKKRIRKKYNIQKEKIILMFAANSISSSYKGAEVLEKALEMINEKEKYELIIVGKDEKKSFQSLFQCHYFGYIDSDDKMNELYNLADVFVLPSKAENFPCTVLESMAAGTPVIGSRAGGIVEQIDDETGWMFDVGNSQQLAEIINDLPNKRKEMSDMSIQCRKKIVNFFSENKMIKQYYELYTCNL